MVVASASSAFVASNFFSDFCPWHIAHLAL
jgi:hypothetical protein